MQTVLLTGGTGLIGSEIARLLVQKGYNVIILSRTVPEKNRERLTYAFWDVDKQIIDETAVMAADHIIHLAGENVASKRWTSDRKQEIVDSRVKSGELLCHTLRKVDHKVQTFISASAIGWYAEDPAIPNPTPFIETDPHADEFLGNVCQQWEQSIQPIKELGIRLVILRTGIVLSQKGGAFKEFRKSLTFGFAFIPGKGRQMVSWIHVDDLVHLYIESMEQSKYDGVYNAVAPEPVSIRRLILELARQSKGKYFSAFNVPPLALKTILGEMSVEVLKSATVSSKKVQNNGYIFLYPMIHVAIRKLLKETAG